MTDRLVYQFSTPEDSLANWASSLVRRVNHSPFSHVDIVLPDGNLLGASDNPDAPVIDSNPAGNPRGVAIRPPDYQKFKYRRQMVLSTKRADAVILAALSQLGKPFDPSGLYGFISDSFPGVRNWRDLGKWFCAEHLFWSEEQGDYWLWALGIKQIEWPKNRVSPTDILLIHQMDPNWANRTAFWEPIPGLKLGAGES